MAALHILQGGIQNGDRDWLIRAAEENLAAKTWIAPKSAEPGDDAVIYVGRALFATARVTRRASRRPDWGPRAYGAALDSIQLIKPPVPIGVIKKRVIGLKWANYPRGVTTPPLVVASQIRELVQAMAGHGHLNSNSEAADIEAIVRDRRLKNETTRRALIDARLGQGRFRANLIERWNGSCAVTRCGLLDVLKASHIKPWSISNNRERLDPANGLLLAANIDALFDSGLVTFDNNGRMLVSNVVSATERKRLGLPRRLRRGPNRREKQYLAEHRRSKFRASQHPEVRPSRPMASVMRLYASSNSYRCKNPPKRGGRKRPHKATR
jgi:HNH endonuclease